MIVIQPLAIPLSRAIGPTRPANNKGTSSKLFSGKDRPGRFRPWLLGRLKPGLDFTALGAPALFGLARPILALLPDRSRLRLSNDLDLLRDLDLSVLSVPLSR